MARPGKIRLGDLLVTQKLITMEQLSFALDQQKRTGRKLGRVLVDNSFVTEEQISEALAKQLNIPFINLKYYKSADNLFEICQDFQILILINSKILNIINELRIFKRRSETGSLAL